MPILEIIAAKTAEALGVYFLEKNLDKYFKDKSDLITRLTNLIYDTIDEYSKKYSIEDKEGRYGFYKSHVIVDELLKYRVMNENYNIRDLYIAFDAEPNVFTPSKEDIEIFYDIFLEKINQDDQFKKIEIRQTFDAEIFIISRKLDSLKKDVENIIGEIHNQLESEWKRQIDVYKSAFNDFKPKTSLELLLKLEESFALNSKKPSESIRAAIEFLKSQCYDFLGNHENVYKCIINAYKLESHSIIYLELACYSYAKLKMYDKAKVLLDDLLKADEFNSIGWLVKTLISDNIDLEILIKDVPELVRKDKDFRRITFYNLFINKRFTNQIDIFQKYLLFPSPLEYEDSEINIRNFKDKLYWIEIKLTEYIRNTSFDFQDNNYADKENIRFLKKISSQFLLRISDSEIRDNYKTLEFFNKYFEFVLNGNKDSVLEMHQIFPKVKNKQDPMVLILANSLQIIGEISLALEVLESEKELSTECLFLKAFCFYKKSDIDNYIKTSKQVLSKLRYIDSFFIESILIIPTTLSIFNRINDIEDSDYQTDKQFEFQHQKTLLVSYLKILKNINDISIVSHLQAIEGEVIEKSPKLCFYISYSYYLIQEYELAINFFKRYLSTEKESRDLIYYILSLKYSHTHHKELLSQLTEWREKFSFNEDFLRTEADLRKQLLDWENCLKVCDAFLNKIPFDEPFLTLELIVLNELGQEEHKEKIKTRAEFFESYEFKNHKHAQIVSSILFQQSLFKTALEILFNRAKDPANREARTDYFMLLVQLPDDLIRELQCKHPA